METVNFVQKPMIGVMPLIDGEKESYWMLPGYMQGIIKGGGIPVMLPPSQDESILDELFDACDAFLFTGGHDVSPEVYGCAVSDKCGEVSPVRDAMEIYILNKAIEENKPILGICRGIQLINAALGGTLYQDLPTEYNSTTEHHQEPPYDRYTHTVRVIENTPLYELLGQGEIGVNSYHHQCVKTLSDRLKVMAVSEDGLTEGVYMPDKKFIWGIQWHPEFLYLSDGNSMKIFEAFVNSAL